MTYSELANLARIGQLKAQPAAQTEFDGLTQSGRGRLDDAKNAANSFAGRFDLAYNAACAVFVRASLAWVPPQAPIYRVSCFAAHPRPRGGDAAGVGKGA